MLAARGDAGVAAVLDHPPTRPMLIEAPRIFLARAPDAAGVPWDAITAPLASIEPPEGDVRRAPTLRRTLREMLRAAPHIDTDALLAALIDVESRVAVAPDGRAQAASTVLLFGDAAAARAYVAASRALQQARVPAEWAAERGDVAGLPAVPRHLSCRPCALRALARLAFLPMRNALGGSLRRAALAHP